MSSGRILVVDDDALECRSLTEMLKLEGYEAHGALSGAEALDQLRQGQFDLVLTDVSMPEITGFDILKEVMARYPEITVILITGYGQIEGAVQAIKAGAYDYIPKPLVDEGVKLTIARALEQQRLRRENANLKRQLNARGAFGPLLGRDHQMQRIYDLIDVVADTKATVLITGESGTGKSLIARTIHMKSSRRDQPFVEVSCGSLPETLLETELFGHTRGSFTGAYTDKVGRFEMANSGTIFLDEISVASPALQVKLLRVLQDHTFEKVGGSKTVSVDVRVIVATNRDLKELIRQGDFREDLYYRLNVITFSVPPLRERVGDIRPLAEYFVQKYSQENENEIKGIHEDALRAMQRYHWPGNVRELEHCIERAVILAKGKYLTLDDIPLPTDRTQRVFGMPFQLMPLKKALEEPEREIIRRTLQEVSWNRARAAEILKVNRSTLFKKLRKYGLDNSPVREGEEKA